MTKVRKPVEAECAADDCQETFWRGIDGGWRQLYCRKACKNRAHRHRDPVRHNAQRRSWNIAPQPDRHRVVHKPHSEIAESPHLTMTISDFCRDRGYDPISRTYREDAA